METCWRRLSLCSSHDKGFRRTSEEEEHPEIRTVGLFSTCTHVRYMCKSIGVRKSPGLGKILLDRFINRFVLDQNTTTEKASQPAHGTDSKPKGSSWLPGILKHCYGHVWASTDQARPQNSERGTSDHLRLCMTSRAIHLELVTDKT